MRKIYCVLPSINKSIRLILLAKLNSFAKSKKSTTSQLYQIKISNYTKFINILPLIMQKNFTDLQIKIIMKIKIT